MYHWMESDLVDLCMKEHILHVSPQLQGDAKQSHQGALGAHERCQGAGDVGIWVGLEMGYPKGTHGLE